MVKSLRFKSSLILASLTTEGLLDILSYDSDRELATSIWKSLLGIKAVPNFSYGTIFFTPIIFANFLANNIPSPSTIRSISWIFLPRIMSLTTPPTI